MSSDSDDDKGSTVIILEKSFSDKGTRISGFDKTLVAVIITLVFFIISMPLMYQLSNKGTSLVGLPSTNEYGVPTLFGLFLHTLIFFIFIRFLMR